MIPLREMPGLIARLRALDALTKASQVRGCPPHMFEGVLQAPPGDRL